MCVKTLTIVDDIDVLGGLDLLHDEVMYMTTVDNEPIQNKTQTGVSIVPSTKLLRSHVLQRKWNDMQFNIDKNSRLSTDQTGALITRTMRDFQSGFVVVCYLHVQGKVPEDVCIIVKFE